jgi:hypothetical protein
VKSVSFVSCSILHLQSYILYIILDFKTFLVFHILSLFATWFFYLLNQMLFQKLGRSNIM